MVFRRVLLLGSLSIPLFAASVRKEVGQAQTLGSQGEYGWGGAHGTYFWIDPAEKTIGILMIQVRPYAHLNIRADFQNAVTQAVID